MEHTPARTLSAQRIKVTLVLSAAELISIPAPEGQPRVMLQVAVAGRTVAADIASKSLRKAQAAIREAGADGVALILQGNLGAGDVISEAGLTAQLKTKPAESAPS
jgi:hypothetical protein